MQITADVFLTPWKTGNLFLPCQPRNTVCCDICIQWDNRTANLDLATLVAREAFWLTAIAVAGWWTPGMVATPGDKNAAFFQKSHTRKADGMPPNWVWIDNPFHCPTVAITVIWFVLNPHPVGLLLPLFDHFDNKPFCTSFSTSAEPMYFPDMLTVGRENFWMAASSLPVHLFFACQHSGAPFTKVCEFLQHPLIYHGTLREILGENCDPWRKCHCQGEYAGVHLDRIKSTPFLYDKRLMIQLIQGGCAWQFAFSMTASEMLF